MCHRRLKFTTLFFSGKSQKVYPVLEPRKLCKIMHCIVLYCILIEIRKEFFGSIGWEAVLTAFGPYALNVRTTMPSYGPRARLIRALYCIVFVLYYWSQRPYSCFTYSIKWICHSILVPPCLCKSSKFSVIAISSSYDICSAFQNEQHFTIVGNFLYAMIRSNK